jgi:hypothetical protein
MKHFAEIEQLRNVQTYLSPPPQPFSYIRIAEIPEPYQAGFRLYVMHKTCPYFPAEGDCAYVWNYRDWMRIIEAGITPIPDI